MRCFDSRGIYVSPRGALAQQPLAKTQPADQYRTHLPGCNYNPNRIPTTPHTTRLVRRRCIQSALIVLGVGKKGKKHEKGVHGLRKKVSTPPPAEGKKSECVASEAPLHSQTETCWLFCPQRLKNTTPRNVTAPPGHAQFDYNLKGFTDERSDPNGQMCRRLSLGLQLQAPEDMQREGFIKKQSAVLAGD